MTLYETFGQMLMNVELITFDRNPEIEIVVSEKVWNRLFQELWNDRRYGEKELQNSYRRDQVELRHPNGTVVVKEAPHKPFLPSFKAF